MKKKTKKIILWSSLAVVGAGGILIAGGIYIASYVRSIWNDSSAAFSNDASAKEILKAVVKKEFQKYKASEFAKAPLGINKYLDFLLEPNISIENLEGKYFLTYEIVPGSIDDYAGTLQILISAQEKLGKKEIEEVTITVSGFQKVENLNSTESRWFTNEINKIKNLVLAQENTELTTENFWESINIPESITLIGNEYTTKNGKSNSGYNFKAYVEKIGNNSYAVELSLGYRQSVNHKASKRVSKLFLINAEFNDNSWQSKLDEDFVKYVLPGNVNLMNEEQLKGTFFANDKDSANIEVLKHLSNNNDGTVYLKKTNTNGSVGYAKYTISSYAQLFNGILSVKGSKIANFLDKELNVANGSRSIFDQYNAQDAFNFRYTRLISYVKTKLSNRAVYLTEKVKLNDAMQLYDLSNFKRSEDGTGLTLDMVNVSGEAYSVFMPFVSSAPNSNIDFNKQNLPLKSLDKLQEDIHKRTMSIAFYERRNVDGEEKEYVTSGTAWIFDKSKTEKNTYFLATNIHVVEKMQANWENVFGFQYSLYNNRTELNSDNVNPFGNVQNVFAKIPKESTIPLPYNSRNAFENPSKYNQFWDAFQVYNLGGDAIAKNVSSDIAIIKITFPQDDVDRFGTIIRKKMPDAAVYYDQMQANKETKLNFFTSKNLTWNQNNSIATLTSGIDFRDNSLPMDLTLGGYFGGHTWITNNGSGFLYYSQINKKSAIPYYENFKDPLQRVPVLDSERNPNQIVMPMAYAGKGMSGSMVLDRFGRVVGIFWGGAFNTEDHDNDQQANLERGIANLEPLGISIKGNKSILEKWLDMTQDQDTELDDQVDEIVNYVS